MAAQSADVEFRERFGPVAKELEKNEANITAELLAAQGGPVDVGGYFLPDDAMAERVMRPSPIFNAVIDRLANAT